MIEIHPDVFALAEHDVAGLTIALQTALEIEHATMPPYLYVFYSLRGTHPEIGEIFRDTFRDEMLHMLLVGNLMNALGTTPVIARPEFVPSYPTSLPGALAGGLKIPLRPLSIALVRDVLMEIEEPEKPLQFEAMAGDMPPRTIGQFYERIKQRIIELDPPLNGGKQLVRAGLGLTLAQQQVTDVASAVRIIEHIVRQGEGTMDSPEITSDGPAHYYRLEQIVRGRKLVPNPAAKPMSPPSERFIFAGAPLPLDEGMIAPMRDSPRAVHFPPNARATCDNFNRAYTRMLHRLQAAFDGGVVQELNGAVNLMRGEMSELATELVNIDLGDGTVAGPTFEYLEA